MSDTTMTPEQRAADWFTQPMKHRTKKNLIAEFKRSGNQISFADGYEQGHKHGKQDALFENNPAIAAVHGWVKE